MALPVNGTLMDVVYNAQIVDLSTASVCPIPIVKAGKLVDGYVSNQAAITSADDVITVKKYPAGVAASAVTCGTITIAYSTSGVGTVYKLAITGSEADCTFASGDALVLDNGGESSTTSIGRASMVIRGA